MSFEAEEDDGPTPRALAQAQRETARVLAQASALYAPFSCGATAECCQLAARQREPWLWPTEWQALLDRLEDDARALPAPREDGGCPFLDPDGKRCTVYADRPFGCRTFFCHRRRGPSREPAERVHALLDTLTAINIGLWSGAKPRAIRDWHGEAWGTGGGTP